MKKYQISLALTALAIVAAAIVCLTVLLCGTAKPGQTDPALPSPRQTQGQVHFTSKPSASQENSENESSETPKNTYVIREYEGHIGVFATDQTSPIQEIDVLINTLPASDRALLAKGITAETEEQLRSILEDYES